MRTEIKTSIIDNCFWIQYILHDVESTAVFFLRSSKISAPSTWTWLPVDVALHTSAGAPEDECEYRPEGKCRCIMSSLDAQTLWKNFISSDSEDTIWKGLEEFMKRHQQE